MVNPPPPQIEAHLRSFRIRISFTIFRARALIWLPHFAIGLLYPSSKGIKNTAWFLYEIVWQTINFRTLFNFSFVQF